jgi:aryl-alcohol dehydrogenase-like predicted oxidoreductase
MARHIGAIEVSEVGLGCNNFGRRVDAAGSVAVVGAALDAGITLFDTADVYGDGASEELLGRGLSGRRDEAVVATKFGGRMLGGPDEHGGSPAWIATAVEASLRRLGTDHLDVYQLHEPDPRVPIEETLGALGELVERGLVREIGCSNFTADGLIEADGTARKLGTARFVSAQHQWSLLRRDVEDEVVPACERLGLAVLPFFPLASGVLTGKYKPGEPPPAGSRLAGNPSLADRFLTDRDVETATALEGFARDHGHTLLELAVSWLLSWPVVCSVITGATRPAQVTANVAAAGWQLTDEDRAEVDRLTAR